MKYLLFILIFCFLFSCGSDHFLQPSEPDPLLADFFFGTDSTLEIITWNIQNFPKKDMITADYVVQIIIAVDAEVVALQEIESSSYFNYVIEKLNEIDLLNTWEGYRSNGASFEINLAYIYKSNFVEVGSIYEIYQDDWYAFPRSPLVFELTYEEQELIVVNNHLKAGGDPEDEDRREEASQKLQLYIEGNFIDSKVILVGDLNDDITEPQETNVFWNFISQPESYLFTDMEIATGSSSNWSYPTWPSHLDHILITNELFSVFEDSLSVVETIKIDQYIDGGWHEYDENVSDHRPVGLKLYFE